MTFCARPIFTANTAGVQVPIPLTSPLSFTGSAGGTCILEVIFEVGGLLKWQGTDNSPGPLTTNDWYSPPESNIGASYWVRLTVTAGTSPNGTPTEAAGSWLQMSTERAFRWEKATSGSTTATVTFEIATDSGGASVVASVTGISISVTKP